MVLMTISILLVGFDFPFTQVTDNPFPGVGLMLLFFFGNGLGHDANVT